MSSFPTTAHPRSRGENPTNHTLSVQSCGSSPLTRGKPHANEVFIFGFRLIPAHAGKTTTYAGNITVLRAHPRSRGENLSSLVDAYGPAGSSPLTRGKRPALRPSRLARRLIPAHAGKTSRTCSAPSVSTAHPRSRGENNLHEDTVTRIRGSSPLTRGKPAQMIVALVKGRLIPAHAGKT